MKIVINKLVADLGEQWSIEIPVPNDVLKAQDPVAGIKAIVAPAMRTMDDRLMEMNMRLLDSNKMAQSLTPEANLALRQVVQVMYGARTNPETQAPVTTQPGLHGQGPRPGDERPDVAAQKAQTALEKALGATDEGGR